MRHYSWLICVVAVACTAGPAQQSPRVLSRGEYVEINHKMKPFIAKARKTLPLVKERYLQGLPQGEQLFVTVKLSDADEAFELTQVKVEDWSSHRLLGKVAGPLWVVQSYHEGDLISFDENTIVDWVIKKSDGSREGDYVGRFLRTCGSSL